MYQGPLSMIESPLMHGNRKTRIKCRLLIKYSLKIVKLQNIKPTEKKWPIMPFLRAKHCETTVWVFLFCLSIAVEEIIPKRSGLK